MLLVHFVSCADFLALVLVELNAHDVVPLCRLLWFFGIFCAASTSTGFKYAHVAELHSFLADALKPGAEVERVDGGFPVWAK